MWSYQNCDKTNGAMRWNADCGVGVGGSSLLLRTFGFIFKQTEKSQELVSWCLDCKKKNKYRPDV